MGATAWASIIARTAFVHGGERVCALAQADGIGHAVAFGGVNGVDQPGHIARRDGGVAGYAWRFHCDDDLIGIRRAVIVSNGECNSMFTNRQIDFWGDARGNNCVVFTPFIVDDCAVTVTAA